MESRVNRCVLKHIDYEYGGLKNWLKFRFKVNVQRKTPDWDLDVPERKVLATFQNVATGRILRVRLTDASPISDGLGGPVNLPRSQKMLGKEFTITHHELSTRPANAINLHTREPVIVDP